MKKRVSSLVTILALNGVIHAGGNVAPIEEVVETPVVADESAFYIGLGVGQSNINEDIYAEEWDSNTFMLQAGYQYNPYVAIEGRYTFGFNMDYNKGLTLGTYNGTPLDNDFSSWGIYVKPSYPIGDFNIYALLGYGGVMLSDIRGGDAYEDGFQWGLGVSYSLMDHISVFADYVSLYDDTGFDYVGTNANWEADTWTIGLTYTF
jgi:opacity protein-like surface antigen